MELSLSSSLSGDRTTDMPTILTLQNAFAGGMKQNMQNLLDVSRSAYTIDCLFGGKVLTSSFTGDTGLHELRCCCSERHPSCAGYRPASCSSSELIRASVLYNNQPVVL
jgi:hypothetical protein